ncbi:hypothetical protein [Nitrospira sp. Kam-Ns4a]
MVAVPCHRFFADIVQARGLLLAVGLVLAMHGPAWGQAVSGVRGINGGVGALHNLVGVGGNLYVDSQGTQGFMYTFGTFESYNFRNMSTGQTWIGSMMTLGPQLSVGLISGGIQTTFSLSTGTNVLASSPLVIPPPPRTVAPPPPIESSFDEIP